MVVGFHQRWLSTGLVLAPQTMAASTSMISDSAQCNTDISMLFSDNREGSHKWLEANLASSCYTISHSQTRSILIHLFANIQINENGIAASAASLRLCRSTRTWIVALSPSSLMISPIKLSAPTRISSYIAAPDMLSAITTGPDTFRTYLYTTVRCSARFRTHVHAVQTAIRARRATGQGAMPVESDCFACHTRPFFPKCWGLSPSCRSCQDRRSHNPQTMRLV